MTVSLDRLYLLPRVKLDIEGGGWWMVDGEWWERSKEAVILVVCTERQFSWRTLVHAAQAFRDNCVW
jgi:hypothetical protein